MLRTHIDPPAYAQPPNKVGNEYGDEAIKRPVVGDTNMPEVMREERELLPEQPEEEGTGDEPAALVAERSGEGEEDEEAHCSVLARDGTVKLRSPVYYRLL